MEHSAERMLVMPRCPVLVYAILTIIGNLCGWFGGALVCKYRFIAVEPTPILARSSDHGYEGSLDGSSNRRSSGFRVLVLRKSAQHAWGTARNWRA